MSTPARRGDGSQEVIGQLADDAVSTTHGSLHSVRIGRCRSRFEDAPVSGPDTLGPALQWILDDSSVVVIVGTDRHDQPHLHSSSSEVVLQTDVRCSGSTSTTGSEHPGDAGPQAGEDRGRTRLADVPVVEAYAAELNQV